MNERLYRVLGTTEDYSGCDCCGRTNLKVYVALEPTEGGPTVYFGTTCAAKAERLPAATIKAEARTADQERRAAEHAARMAAADAEQARFLAWVAEQYGIVATQAADLWNKVEGMTPFQLRKAWQAVI